MIAVTKLGGELELGPTKTIVPNLDDWPKNCYKYANFFNAYHGCGSAYVRDVLDVMADFAGTNNLLVDIKLQHLKSGDYPCIPGWHLDGTDVNEEETFYLFVVGQPITEFVVSPIELTNVPSSCGDLTQYAKVNSEWLFEHAIIHRIKEKQIVKYTNKHFHRGPIAKRPGRRLLIRGARSDRIRPRNKPL